MCETRNKIHCRKKKHIEITLDDSSWMLVIRETSRILYLLKSHNFWFFFRRARTLLLRLPEKLCCLLHTRKLLFLLRHRVERRLFWTSRASRAKKRFARFWGESENYTRKTWTSRDSDLCKQQEESRKPKKCKTRKILQIPQGNVRVERDILINETSHSEQPRVRRATQNPCRFQSSFANRTYMLMMMMSKVRARVSAASMDSLESELASERFGWDGEQQKKSNLISCRIYISFLSAPSLFPSSESVLLLLCVFLFFRVSLSEVPNIFKVILPKSFSYCVFFMNVCCLWFSTVLSLSLSHSPIDFGLDCWLSDWRLESNWL